MRKSLLTGLLGAALLITPVVFSTKSGAANPLQPKPAAATPRAPQSPLPNYDIRLAGRGEVAGTDVGTRGRAQGAPASGNAALRARAPAGGSGEGRGGEGGRSS